MASAPLERLDPVLSLAPPPAPDETHRPSPSFSDGARPGVAGGVDGDGSAAPGAAATAPSGFPVLGLLAAVTVHVLVAVALYALILREPPQETKPPGDVFEIVLNGDKAGRADGTAKQAPDGAPKPEALQDPDARTPNLPADQPVTDAMTAPQRPVQPPSFDAMPMPPAPQPVPDTADAWTPRVSPSVALPLPATEPKTADLQTPPKTDAAKTDTAKTDTAKSDTAKTDTAKPPPAQRPVARPARPPAPAPAPPAPRPSVQAAAPPVAHQPTMQRSVDVREIAGLAPHRDRSAGSSSGNALAADYASRLFRAIDRVRFYPVGSRERREEGRVVLRVTIGANGHLLDAYIVSSSGHPELDAATIEMARRAAPYPPLPRGLGAERASFNVPIIFGIRFRR